MIVKYFMKIFVVVKYNFIINIEIGFKKRYKMIRIYIKYDLK